MAAWFREACDPDEIAGWKEHGVSRKGAARVRMSGDIMVWKAQDLCATVAME